MFQIITEIKMISSDDELPDLPYTSMFQDLDATQGTVDDRSQPGPSR